MTIEIINGAPLPAEALLGDTGIRPWVVDDEDHEHYLLPVSETPRHLPRVIHPEYEAGFLDEHEGYWVPTWWTGDGRGGVARTPWGAPMVRAIAMVERNQDVSHRVWAIADGFRAPNGKVIPSRATYAISGELKDGADEAGLRWASVVMADAGERFFRAPKGGTVDPFAMWRFGEPIEARDMFRSARSLYRFEDVDNYPSGFRALLRPFSLDRRELASLDRRDGLRADLRYAALGLAFIVGRALREPDTGGRLQDPLLALGGVIGKSRATVEKLVQEAVRRRVLTPPLDGRGRRALEKTGSDLLFELLGEWHDGNPAPL